MSTRTEFLDRVGQWSGIAVHADHERASRDIRLAVPFAPADYWLLVCSALLACLGLDTDSTAVIIGAMLVSPLMAPILGVGLAFGTSDRDLFKSSLRTLTTAVGLGLVIATLYFMISPLGEVTRELQARTRPTLLDAGVAFFGGIAGIVAGTRDRAGSAIPGVAIATALMPPLCTVGFGLASRDIAVALGAFYLFFINAVLIALATYLVVRLLRLPLREVAPRDVTRRRLWLTTVVSIVLLPSAVILVGVARDARRQRALSGFADAVSNRADRTVLRWSQRTDGDSTVLSLFVAGAPMNEAAVDSLRVELRRRGLADLSLRVVETGLPQSARETLAGEATLAAVKAAEAVATRAASLEVDRRLGSAPRVALNRPGVAAVEREVQAWAPEVSALALGRVQGSDVVDSAATRGVAIVQLRGRLNGRAQATLEERLARFLSERLAFDSMAILVR